MMANKDKQGNLTTVNGQPQTKTPMARINENSAEDDENLKRAMDLSMQIEN